MTTIWGKKGLRLGELVSEGDGGEDSRDPVVLISEGNTDSH